MQNLYVQPIAGCSLQASVAPSLTHYTTASCPLKSGTTSLLPDHRLRRVAGIPNPFQTADFRPRLCPGV